MNGNDPNYNEAGSPGAYAGTPGEGTGTPHSYDAGQTSGSYNAEAHYTAAGSNYTNPAGMPGSDPYGASGYAPPPPGYIPPYGAPVPPPPVPGSPNPGLAVLLGFIPGVGAMYNGQFAKGIAHIVIFAVLTKLADHFDLFGIFVAGWVFYMVFDAYQTARARRDGLVVPDPFGLNNIGERFGMPHNPNWGDFMARPAAGSTSTADSARTSNPYAGPPADPVAGAPVSGYSAATPGYAAPASGYSYVPPTWAQPTAAGPYVPPPPYPGAVPPNWQPGYPDPANTQAYPVGGAPNAPYQATYAPFDPAAMPPYPLTDNPSRIPSGAIWLIGLGVLALIGSLAHNFYWRGYFFGAAACFVFGIVLLVQQTARTGKLYPRGTAAYQWNLLHSARFGLTLILIGILQTLAGAHVTSWNYLWPYLLIAFGLLQVADRSLYNRMLLEPPVYPNGYAPAPPAAASDVAASTASSTTTPEEEVR